LKAKAARLRALTAGLVLTAHINAFVVMVQNAVALTASASVHLVTRATIVRMSAPVEGLVCIVKMSVIVTFKTAHDVTLELACAFVHLVSKAPDAMSIVKMAFMARTAIHHVRYVRVMFLVHVRNHMETARALLVTKVTCALMTVI